ncbi:unnamed protein product [Aphis gossypii]|uniref:THAP-type domain-containing protein n=1 Tax=Aphis gossypii TaxID=80765 RepID=A0A9P0J1Z7_APHGO|nr:unnamed protein product [Aphis gossypii]
MPFHLCTSVYLYYNSSYSFYTFFIIIMPSKQCVVVDCDTSYRDTITLRHRFPRDEPTFNIWVERSGNPHLLNLSIDDVYKSFIMCDKHFASSCKSPGCKKLIKTAVPTLNLPHYNDMGDDTDNMSIEFVTENFWEDTNRQMSTEFINCIKSSDIDVKLNTDMDGTFKTVPRSPPQLT